MELWGRLTTSGLYVNMNEIKILRNLLHSKSVGK